MKTQVNLIIPLFLIFLLFLRGSPSETQREVGTLAGIVSDRATAQPIAGASVVLLGTTLGTITNTRGEYRISDIPEGTYDVQVSFAGYQTTISARVRVHAGQEKTLDFRIAGGVLLNEMVVEYDRRLLSTDALGVAKQSYSIRERQNTPGRVESWVGDIRRSDFNTEEYAFIEETGFVDPLTRALSTFSIDVDAASYAIMRRYINSSQRPPKDAIRTEELVNYFDYSYPDPVGRHPMSIYTEVARAPWNPYNLLLHIGLKAKDIATEDLRPSNLVFLLDVSGSMSSADKLGLLKQSFKLLVQELTAADQVSIVVYAGAAGLVLPPTPGNEKNVIFEALDRLQAGGSTAGGAGIQLAYDVARKHLIKNGNNRVILATDGDFNIGVSGTGDLVRLIQAYKKDGIGLTILGFGSGNLKDSRMEAMADKGDGNYFYIDTIREGKKVFVDQLRSNLYTLAHDVKIQVEFNPAIVGEYRLIGYENRMLNAEDFQDDKKDAGEIGPGHTVTALYEIVLAENVTGRTHPGLRYQNQAFPVKHDNELGIVKVRYKNPGESTSIAMDAVIVSFIESETTDNFRFSAAVAMFSMLLRDSGFTGNTTAAAIIDLAGSAKGQDEHGYRAEFIRLVETYDLVAMATARPVTLLD